MTAKAYPPYQAHSRTSAAAADSMAGKRLTQMATLYLALLSEGDRGLTDEEAQDLLGMNPSTERPRRIELIAMGKVIDSGRTRRTRSGRQATIWLAVPEHGQLGLPLKEVSG